jgi:hypothetical protein
MSFEKKAQYVRENEVVDMFCSSGICDLHCSMLRFSSVEGSQFTSQLRIAAGCKTAEIVNPLPAKMMSETLTVHRQSG